MAGYTPGHDGYGCFFSLYLSGIGWRCVADRMVDPVGMGEALPILSLYPFLVLRAAGGGGGVVEFLVSSLEAVEGIFSLLGGDELDHP